MMNVGRNTLSSSATLLIVLGLAGCASIIGVDDPAYQPDAGEDSSIGGSRRCFMERHCLSNFRTVWETAIGVRSWRTS